MATFNTDAALQASVDAKLPNNNTRQISPADVRTSTQDMINHRPAQSREIAVMSGQFDDLKAVVEGITDSGISKPYVVTAYAGVYDIGDNDITVPAYVTIRAEGSVIITATGNTTKNVFIMAGGSVLSGLTIQGHQSSLASVIATGTGSYVFNDIVFLDCSLCMNINNAAASATIRGVTLLPFSAVMTNGVRVSAGQVTVLDLTVGGSLALNNALYATGSDADVYFNNFQSISNASVVYALRAESSATLRGAAFNIVGATRGIWAASQAVVSLGAGRVAGCDYGAYIEGAGTIFSGFGTSLLTSVTSNVFAGAGTILTGTGVSDSADFQIDPTATILMSFLDVVDGDEAFSVIGELHIGTPTRPSETCLGEGDSYTNGMLVYTYDGAGYTDVSADAASPSGSTFAFPNLLVNTALYFASTRPVNGGGDFVKHHGLKLNIVTAQVGGTIVFEYWDGSSWVEFNGMVTNGGSPYLPEAKAYFEHTDSHQIRFNPTMVNDNWTKNDDPSVGTDYFWTRARITSALTTAPVIEQVKLHSSRMEVNGDGWPEYFGNARPIGWLPWDVGLLYPANSSPVDQDVYISDFLDIGRRENKFANNTSDRIGFNAYLPLDLDTSAPVVIQFAVKTDDATAGDIDWLIRWGYTADGDNVYDNVGDAPTTGPNEQSIASSEAAPTAANVQKSYQFELDVSDMLSRRSGGFGDILWVTIQRTNGDSHGGDVSMINITAYYSKWTEGGHLIP